MTRFTSVTPNLVVKDVAPRTAFYRDVLGFQIKQTVPDAGPFVFVWLERDAVPVFLNDVKAATNDFPAMASAQFGGTAVMPLKTQFYGMREFAITDPDGHIITFAERIGE